MPDRLPMQRAVIGGRPRVVHGLRAAQPGAGEASTSPQPGQRWATGGRPDADLSGARLCLCVARLDALRSSRRLRVSGDRALRRKTDRHVCSDCNTTARLSRRCCALAAVTVRACTALLGRLLPRRCAPHAPRRLPAAVRGRLRWATRSVAARSASCLALACAGCARAHRLATQACSVCDAAAHPARLPLRSSFASPIPVSRGSCTLRMTFVARAHGASGGQWT